MLIIIVTIEHLQAPRCSCSHFRNERHLDKRLRSTANYVALSISTLIQFFYSTKVVKLDTAEGFQLQKSTALEDYERRFFAKFLEKEDDDPPVVDREDTIIGK